MKNCTPRIKLDEIDEFLKKNTLLKLTQEEMKPE